jgi:hypothetical protein
VVYKLIAMCGLGYETVKLCGDCVVVCCVLCRVARACPGWVYILFEIWILRPAFTGRGGWLWCGDMEWGVSIKTQCCFHTPTSNRTVPRASRPVNTERRSITQLLLATIAEKKWASRVRARNRLQDPSTAFVSRRHRQIFLANNAEIEAGLVHHPSVSTIFAH